MMRRWQWRWLTGNGGRKWMRRPLLVSGGRIWFISTILGSQNIWKRTLCLPVWRMCECVCVCVCDVSFTPHGRKDLNVFTSGDVMDKLLRNTHATAHHHHHHRRRPLMSLLILSYRIVVSVSCIRHSNVAFLTFLPIDLQGKKQQIKITQNGKRTVCLITVGGREWQAEMPATFTWWSVMISGLRCEEDVCKLRTLSLRIESKTTMKTQQK